jgi:hypothetical protein
MTSLRNYSSFTFKFCDARANGLLAGNIHLLANRKILNLDKSEGRPSLRYLTFHVRRPSTLFWIKDRLSLRDFFDSNPSAHASI